MPLIYDALENERRRRLRRRRQFEELDRTRGRRDAQRTLLEQLAGAGDRAFRLVYGSLPEPPPPELLTGEASRRVVALQEQELVETAQYHLAAAGRGPKRPGRADELVEALAHHVEAALAEGEHAPKGGISVGGKRFEGGQFIPARYLKSKADRDKLAAAKRAAGGKGGGSVANNKGAEDAAKEAARKEYERVRKAGASYRRQVAPRVSGAATSEKAAGAIRGAFHSAGAAGLKPYKRQGADAIAEAVAAALLGHELRSGGAHGFDTAGTLRQWLGDKAPDVPVLIDAKSSEKNGYDEKPDAKLAKVKEWQEHPDAVPAYLVFARGHGVYLHLGIDPAGSPPSTRPPIRPAGTSGRCCGPTRWGRACSRAGRASPPS